MGRQRRHWSSSRALAVCREQASRKIAWSMTLFANPRNYWNQYAPFRMLSCLSTTPGIHFNYHFLVPPPRIAPITTTTTTIFLQSQAPLSRQQL